MADGMSAFCFKNFMLEQFLKLSRSNQYLHKI